MQAAAGPRDGGLRLRASRPQLALNPALPALNESQTAANLSTTFRLRKFGASDTVVYPINVESKMVSGSGVRPPLRAELLAQGAG